MADEVEQVRDEDVQFGAQDYINNLNALRETTVSKEEYNKILQENKKLANALINGYSIEQQKEEPIDVDKLRKELFSNKYKKTTDLEFFTKVEELSKGIEQSGGIDPYLPNSKDYIPTGDDIERAQRIHTVIRECIAAADGDPQYFTNELQRRCNTQKLKR